MELSPTRTSAFNLTLGPPRLLGVVRYFLGPLGVSRAVPGLTPWVLLLQLENLCLWMSCAEAVRPAHYRTPRNECKSPDKLLGISASHFLITTLRNSHLLPNFVDLMDCSQSSQWNCKNVGVAGYFLQGPS